MIAAGGPAAIIARKNARAQDGSTEVSGRSVDWSEADNAASVQTASADGFTTINTEFPISAVGAHWPNEAGTWPVIEVRLSLDGITYTESFFVGIDQDIGKETRDNRHFTNLLMSGGASFIQYRVVDTGGDLQSIPGLVITYIDASEGPTLNELPSVSVATTDPSRPPLIISRQGWGAVESYRFRGGVELWPPDYALVHHAIVHHTETSNVQDPVEAMRAVYYYHAITRGWGDIAYNYLVDRFGTIYEGRVGGQNVVGSHAYLYNSGSSGVCLIGNFLFQDMTVSAKASLVAILAWLVRDLDPLATSDFCVQPNLPTICSHRDVNATTCPGDFAYDDLPEIRQLVAAVLQTPPDGPPAGLVLGDTVLVETDDGGPLNLRAAAGIDAEILAELPNGEVGIVTGGPTMADDLPWYQISANLGNGWSTAEFLDIAPPDLPGGGLYKIGDTLSVNVDSLGLLQMPTSSAAVIARMFRNEVALVVAGPKWAEGTIWYQVHEQFTTGGFRTGWANQNRFTRVSDVPPEPERPLVAGDVVQVTASLNLRTAPATTETIISTMPAGTIAEVIGGPFSGSGIQWYQVRIASGTGYAAADYLSKTSQPAPPGPTPSPTPAPSPTPDPGDPGPAPDFVPGDVVEVIANLRLRTSPSTSGGVISTMPFGMLGTVVSGPQTASGYEWWQITVQSGTGWAAGSYLRKSSSVPPPPPAARFVAGDTVATVSAVNFRSGPSTSSSIITLLQAEVVGTVVTGPETGSGYTWWRVTMPLGTGWVADPFLEETNQGPPPPPPPQYLPGASVRATANLRLRGAASTGGTTIKIMSAGSVSTIKSGPQFANGYTWWQLLNGADTGWAAGEFLEPA
ncbi:hypothetical protein BH20CHL4_BH20CHL4_13160 [soil metagenome]